MGQYCKVALVEQSISFLPHVRGRPENTAGIFFCCSKNVLWRHPSPALSSNHNDTHRVLSPLLSFFLCMYVDRWCYCCLPWMAMGTMMVMVVVILSLSRWTSCCRPTPTLASCTKIRSSPGEKSSKLSRWGNRPSKPTRRGVAEGVVWAVS